MEDWSVHLLINHPVLLFVVLASVVLGSMLTITALILQRKNRTEHDRNVEKVSKDMKVSALK